VEVHGGEQLVELGHGAGPDDRDHRRAALHEPGEHHLARGGAQLGRDLAQDGQPLLAGGMV
jgi:hypothetical protein